MRQGTLIPSLVCLLLLGGRVLAVPSFQEVQAKYKGLPESNAAEKIKKAVIGVALERVQSSMEVKETRYAQALLEDIQAALSADAAVMSAQNSSAENISTLTPLRVKKDNPYLDRLAGGARDFLATPEVPWVKATLDNYYFDTSGSGDYGYRVTGERMDALLWLFVHPDSPLQSDPEILARFLRRAHAYADTLDTHPEMKAGDKLLDDFAITPASCAFREFAALYPGLLLPSQKAQWDRAMRFAADQMMGKAEGREGRYANIDLALSIELLNFGLYFKDEKFMEKSRFLLEAQEANIYPDGAMAYIGSQNESISYHGVISYFFARYYEISGLPMALELLKKLEWYGPVSCGKLGEFWTAPSWKQQWNMQGTSPGGEFVVASTGNPYVRGMIGQPKGYEPKDRKWQDARREIAWYDGYIQPKPLPDNYTVMDRNIQGPRAWYGPFSYAATLRAIPVKEPGHATLMGCMLADPDNTMQTAVFGVYPRVKNGSKDAWLTSGLKSSLTLGRRFSVFSGSYDLAQYGSSSKGRVVDWQGRQLWLGLPDRIIGLIQLLPARSQAEADLLEGVIRLGIGGTVVGKAQEIARSSDDTFRYGDLTVKIHAHNYKAVEPVTVPFRLPKAPATEIKLTDTGNKPHFFMVEIRPSWAQGEATVTELSAAPGVSALEIKAGSRQFDLYANFSDTAANIALPVIPGGSLRVSGSDLPLKAGSRRVTLESRQQAVWVASPDPEDHLPGWTNYREMLAKSPAQF